MLLKTFQFYNFVDKYVKYNVRMNLNRILWWQRAGRARAHPRTSRAHKATESRFSILPSHVLDTKKRSELSPTPFVYCQSTNHKFHT